MRWYVDSGASILELLVFTPVLFALFFVANDLGLYAFQRYQAQAQLTVFLLGHQSQVASAVAESERAYVDIASQFERRRVELRFSPEDGRLVSVYSQNELPKQEAVFLEEYLWKARKQIPHLLAKRKLRHVSFGHGFYAERAAYLFSLTKKRKGLLQKFSAKFAALPEEVFIAEIIVE